MRKERNVFIPIYIIFLGFCNINVKNDLAIQFPNPQLSKYQCAMKSEYLKFWDISISHLRKLEFYQKF